MRIATEGALLGGLIARGVSPDLVVLSDGAPQFVVLVHAACWIHVSSPIHRTQGVAWDFLFRRSQNEPCRIRFDKRTWRFGFQARLLVSSGIVIATTTRPGECGTVGQTNARHRPGLKREVLCPFVASSP